MTLFAETTFKDYSCHLVTINYFNVNLLPKHQFGTMWKIHFKWNKNTLFIGDRLDEKKVFF